MLYIVTYIADYNLNDGSGMTLANSIGGTLGPAALCKPFLIDLSSKKFGSSSFNSNLDPRKESNFLQI